MADDPLFLSLVLVLVLLLGNVFNDKKVLFWIFTFYRQGLELHETVLDSVCARLFVRREAPSDKQVLKS